MIFEQHYLDCLSQASYFIGDETSKRAVVVDPRRDIAPYLDSAREHGMTIELVLETHFHADFLSGHLELAHATGAVIAYGDKARTEFESLKLAHGERIGLGQVELEIRHTPGHTPESISIVVYENADAGEPHAVLTGDTLFIGDVGRPDLLSSKGVSSEELAGGVVQPGAAMILVTDDGQELESKIRLARIGFDNVVGTLDNPLAAFNDNPDEVAPSSRVDVAGMREAMDSVNDLQIVDVRQPGETDGGIIDGAILIPLTMLTTQLASLDASRPTIVYCAGGYRSSIAASRLAAAGFTDVSDLRGGYGAWQSATASMATS